jgi:hypothetical protein
MSFHAFSGNQTLPVGNFAGTKLTEHGKAGMLKRGSTPRILSKASPPF